MSVTLSHEGRQQRLLGGAQGREGRRFLQLLAQSRGAGGAPAVLAVGGGLGRQVLHGLRWKVAD